MNVRLEGDIDYLVRMLVTSISSLRRRVPIKVNLWIILVECECRNSGRTSNVPCTRGFVRSID